MLWIWEREAGLAELSICHATADHARHRDRKIHPRHQLLSVELLQRTSKVIIDRSGTSGMFEPTRAAPIDCWTRKRSRLKSA